jgi:hypothetical protein
MFVDPEELKPRFTVAFSCCECGGDFCRVVRHDPESVRRCLRCDAANVRDVSERLLAEVRDDGRFRLP